MDTIYYNKYLKYKKKYLDLKEYEKSMNQSGGWSVTNASNYNGNRNYADLSLNPTITLKENDISTNFNAAGYNHVDTGRYKYVYSNSGVLKIANMYSLEYMMILADMSSDNITNDFGNILGKGQKVENMGSYDLFVNKGLNDTWDMANALGQIYLMQTFRDVSGIVEKYLQDPSANFKYLSNAYHDLSHDIKRGDGFYFTVPFSFRPPMPQGSTPKDSSNLMRYYEDTYYGFDLSNTIDKTYNNPANGLSIHGELSQVNLSDPNTTGRVEYIQVKYSEARNVNIKENDEQALAVLGVLMKYHKYMEDNILDQAEKAILRAQITAIQTSLANVRNELNAKLTDKDKLLLEKTNDYSKEKFAKERLASKRDKTNQAISDLGKMLLELNGQKKKSNTITLSSFFGL